MSASWRWTAFTSYVGRGLWVGDGAAAGESLGLGSSAGGAAGDGCAGALLGASGLGSATTPAASFALQPVRVSVSATAAAGSRAERTAGLQGRGVVMGYDAQRGRAVARPPHLR